MVANSVANSFEEYVHADLQYISLPSRPCFNGATAIRCAGETVRVIAHPSTDVVQKNDVPIDQRHQVCTGYVVGSRGCHDRSVRRSWLRQPQLHLQWNFS